MKNLEELFDRCMNMLYKKDIDNISILYSNLTLLCEKRKELSNHYFINFNEMKFHLSYINPDFEPLVIDVVFKNKEALDSISIKEIKF